MSREKPLLLQKWQFSRDIWLTLPHQLLLGEGWSSPMDLLCLIQVVVSVFSTYLKDFRQQPDWQTLAPVMFLSNKSDWQRMVDLPLAFYHHYNWKRKPVISYIFLWFSLILTFDFADDCIHMSHGTQALISTDQSLLNSGQHLVSPTFQLSHLYTLDKGVDSWPKLSTF